MKGGPHVSCKYLKGGCRHVGVSLLSQVTSNRMNLNLGRFKLDKRKKKFHTKVCQALEKTVQATGGFTTPGNVQKTWI